MFIPKPRLEALVTASLPLLLALSLGVATIAPHSAYGQEPGKAEAKGGKLNDLLKERLEVARENARMTMEAFKTLSVAVDEVREANRLLVRAELDACDSDKARIAVLEKAVAEARNLEDIMTRFTKAGQAPVRHALRARADRLQAEIALERAKARPAGGAALDARDAVALAESEVAIKRAAVKIAATQEKIALAKLANAKTQLESAEKWESYRALVFKRMADLFKQGSLEERLVDEKREQWEAAKAQRKTSEGKITEYEAHVALERARVEMAQAEAQHAELRLKQLKALR
jgi:hypothetical protein